MPTACDEWKPMRGPAGGTAQHVVSMFDGGRERCALQGSARGCFMCWWRRGLNDKCFYLHAGCARGAVRMVQRGASNSCLMQNSTSFHRSA